MLFNSIEYLIYLPIVFLLYWLVFGKRLRLQNLFVVVVSYLFYGWWDYRFLALIALTSFCSWLSGIGIEEVRARAGKILRWFDKGIVVANVIFNLLILSFFKYYDFFVDSLVDAFSYIGISLHISTLSLLLPVGISFYTFQALSYTIDVYRGKLPVTRDIVSFFAFVSFFPQLVAGPIERATNLLIQFERPRSFEYNYESGKYKIEVDGEVLSGKLYKEGRTLNLSIDGQYDIPDMDFAVTRGAKLQKFSGDEFDIGNADADDLYDLVDDITDELSDFDYLIDLF